MEDVRRIERGEGPDHRAVMRADETARRERQGVGLEDQEPRAAGTKAAIAARGTALVLIGGIAAGALGRRDLILAIRRWLAGGPVAFVGTGAACVFAGGASALGLRDRHGVIAAHGHYGRASESHRDQKQECDDARHGDHSKTRPPIHYEPKPWQRLHCARSPPLGRRRVPAVVDAAAPSVPHTRHPVATRPIPRDRTPSRRTAARRRRPRRASS